MAADEEAEELWVAAPDAAGLERYVLRRERGEPLAWITGGLRFCGHRVGVNRGVFVPRPQSAELARRAGEVLAARGPGGRAADLCTGSGAVAVHLSAVSPDAGVVGLDLHPAAVACARGNGVRAVCGDVTRPPFRRRVFDVVTAVAPYVPSAELTFLPSDVQRYEPRFALDGGGDGLDLVRHVVTSAGWLLRPGGWLFTELGGEQDQALAPSLGGAGFDRWVTWRDDDGDLRGMAARLGG
ncbi:MAG: N5-glutamine methyltransferase family protein [Acidimicrobiales bacterium]